MKGIIIYKGKYGATDQYAHLLGSALQIPVIASDSVRVKDVEKYDYVIIGSSVYIGKLLIRDWLKKNMATILSKKIFIFTVSGTPPGNTQKLETIARENIPEEIRNRCQVYFLHGRMIKKNLSRFDRFLLKTGAMFARDPSEKKGMLEDFDDVKIEHLGALTKAVNEYEKQDQDRSQIQTPAER